MHKRNVDPAFDADEVENQDPYGEQAFEEGGFADTAEGEPLLGAPGLEDDSVNKRPGRLPQKVAGVPDAEQHEQNTPSIQRPDSQGVVVRERGGASKGDPAVGGTRPE